MNNSIFFRRLLLVPYFKPPTISHVPHPGPIKSDLIQIIALNMATGRSKVNGNVTNGVTVDKMMTKLRIEADKLTPAFITFTQRTPPPDRDYFTQTLVGSFVPLVKGRPVSEQNGGSPDQEKNGPSITDWMSQYSYQIVSRATDVTDKYQLPMSFLTSTDPKDPDEEHLLDIDNLLGGLSERGPCVVVYCPITSSTQDILENLITQPCLLNVPILVVAGKQVSGRGRRSERTWTSPSGCAMFSFNVCVGSESKMGNKLGFIQHFMALAIIRVLNSLGHRDKIDVCGFKIKWPNDIYYQSHKIAGIIVSTTLSTTNNIGSGGQTFNVCIGAGINVDNHTPTNCINSVLRQLSKIFQLEEDVSMSVEEVISKVVLEFDQIIHEVQNWDDCVFQRYKDDYIDHWMHTNQVINYAVDGEDDKKLRIKSVDDQGYLIVEDMKSKKVYSLIDFDNVHIPVPEVKTCVHP